MDNSLKIAVPIVVALVVIGICVGMLTGWFGMSKSFMENSTQIASKQQLNINKDLVGHTYPTINGNNIRIKKDKELDLRTYITATDSKDGDISNKLEFYGDIDIHTKGIYKVRCVVVNSLGMKTVRYIQVAVD